MLNQLINRFQQFRTLFIFGLVAVCGAATLLGFRVMAKGPAGAKPSTQQQSPNVGTIGSNAYRQTNLVSDVAGAAQFVDPSLVNPWGITQSATSPFWVSNAGTGTSTLYGGDVAGSPFTKNPLTVTIPGGGNTGIVFNGTSGFVITDGSGTGPARFIFATTAGTIAAWRSGTTAISKITAPASAYTGLAIGSDPSSTWIYAANFRAGRIDTYSASFTSVGFPGTNFVDVTIPAGFAPFNVQNLGGKIYVTYALQGPGHDIPGPGNGFVDVFDVVGNFQQRLISNGVLNSPWGLAIAPASFGTFANALLVGNFGDGRINAFDRNTGTLLGTLTDQANNPLQIDGLWALTFGNGVGGGDVNNLYFTAGIGKESHGLLGSLVPAAPAPALIGLSSATYSVGEGAGLIDVTVTRSGDTSLAATVNFTTYANGGAGDASPRTDFVPSLGTLRFAAAEVSKTFRALVVDDVLAERDETFTVLLSNPTGAALAAPSSAVVTITDNDGTVSPVPSSYVGRLNGAQEVPAKVTNGTGNGIVIVTDEATGAATVSISFSGLTSNAVAGHIHGPALPGVNAPVLFPLPIPTGATSGAVSNFAITLTPTQLQQMKDGLFYFNVHDTNNPGGEIRGQISSNVVSPVPATFVSSLDGPHEVPAKVTNGTGTGVVIVTNEATGAAKASLAFSGLGSNSVAAHIHGPALPGVNAPVLFPLPIVAGSTSGGVNDFAITLTPTQIQQLKDGLLYFNVHTTVNPGGEIRGQIFSNPIDESSYFVREQYLDFLNRQPDASGQSFWASQIDNCGVNTNCISNKRIDVSASFFIATEFQVTDFYVYKVRKASYGVLPTFSQFTLDRSQIGTGSAADKKTFTEGFVLAGDFLGVYPLTQTGVAFIDKLVATVLAGSGVDLTLKKPDLQLEYLSELTQTASRARVIRRLVDYPEFSNPEFNRGFVAAEYYGYLRRDPDPAGFNFWLGVLNNNVPGNTRAMVCGFLTSAEFQARTGPTVTRTNAECATVAP